MKYMLMVYDAPYRTNRVGGWSDDHVAYGAALAASGDLVSCEGLADPVNATWVRRHCRDATRASGSPGDMVLTGYYLVDCDGFERAVDLAARIPGTSSVTVEVRPVMDVAGLEM